MLDRWTEAQRTEPRTGDGERWGRWRLVGARAYRQARLGMTLPSPVASAWTENSVPAGPRRLVSGHLLESFLDEVLERGLIQARLVTPALDVEGRGSFHLVANAFFFRFREFCS